MNGSFRIFPCGSDSNPSAVRIIVAKRKNASLEAEIFIKIRLCRFCDKVADYAKTIEREAEKALGAKGSWNQALNNSSSYFNSRTQIILESKQK